MAPCRIKWVKRGARQWVSADKRFSITHQPRATIAKYYVVDLDTYNDSTARTLKGAKRAACKLPGKVHAKLIRRRR